MANPLCPCCNDMVEHLISLPCHPQHQSCRTCLEVRREPIGRSIKCQDCREVFGWLDLDLLAVSNGEIPERQTCNPCKEEGNVVQAQYFCIACQKPVCEGCKKIHDRFFKSEQHEVVPFNEYRKQSDQLTRQYCEVPEHASLESISLCINCKHVLCSKCLEVSCTEQERHIATSLEKESMKLLLEFDTEIAYLQDKIDKSETPIKQTQIDMETLRVKTENLKAEINETFDAKLRSITETLEQKRTELLQTLGEHIQTSAAEVTEYIEAAKESVTQLNSAKEGLSAVAQFTHPTRLLQIQGEVKEQIGEIRRWEDGEKPAVSYYASFPTNCPFGLDISFPSAPLVPTSLTHLRTVKTPKECYTVEFDCSDDLIHAGLLYSSNNIGNIGNIVSLRQYEDGLYLISIRKTAVGLAFSVTLQIYGRDDSTKPQSYGEILQKRSAATQENALSRLAITKSHMFQFLYSMYIYNRSTGKFIRKVGGVHNATGGCSDEDEKNLYISDQGSGSLLVYNIADGIIRKLCSGLPSPQTPRLHRGMIYVLNSNSDSQLCDITVLNQTGQILQKFILPDTGEKRMDDFAINSQGLVAVANKGKGVQMYQLIYEKPEEE